MDSKELVYEERTVPELEYAFRHALTQEATYQSVFARLTDAKCLRLKQRRREFHLKVAQEIESLYQERLEEYYEELAHHYSKSDNAQKAVEYLLKAGQKAYQNYLNDAAINYFQQTLGLLRDAPADKFRQDWRPEVATQLNEKLGDLLELTGQHDEAATAYQNAITQVPKHDQIWKSRIYRKIGNVRLSQRLPEEALQAYGMAETTLGKKPVEPAPEWWQEWVQNQLDRMWMHYRLGRVEEITALKENVYSAVEQYGTPIQRAEFFQCLSAMNLRRERYMALEETLAYSQAALAAVQESANLSEIAFAYFMLGFVYLWHGDFDEAEEHIQAALPMAEKVGDIILRSRCLNYLTLIYRKLGQVETVQRYIPLSLNAAAEAQLPEYTGTTTANLAWAAWRKGNLSEAQENCQAALEAWKQVPSGYATFCFKWTALWPLIGVALTQNEIHEAIDYARALLDLSQQRLPDALTSVLEEAIKTWEQVQAETTCTNLNRAIELAQKMGYL